MQHDDVIWGSLNRHFCSYMVRVTRRHQKFCRNKYNLTGLCERMSCPLANSRYGTIIENDNKLYLFLKTAERAHSPRRLWERIRLSSNYRTALTQIDKHLEHWPEFYIHKAKQRLTKMTQYLIRKRKMALAQKTRLVGINKKVERREASREAKAQRAAKLEESIEKQLLQRLHSNAYGDIYNFDQSIYDKLLDHQEEQEGEKEGEQDQDGGDVYLDLDDDSDEEEDDEDLDEYEAHIEDEDEEELEGEEEDHDDELSDGEEDDDEDDVGDIETLPSKSNAAQYDFDDDDDDDEGEGDDDDDDDDGNNNQRPLARPRTASELDAYVREKARRRSATQKASSKSAIPPKKKGRKLRPSKNMEYEYERESEKQNR